MRRWRRRRWLWPRPRGGGYCAVEEVVDGKEGRGAVFAAFGGVLVGYV